MRIPPTRLICSALLCGFLILIAGCGNPSSQTLNSLTVTATPSTINVGGAAILKAMAHLSDGTTQDVTSSTQWTASNSSLATIGNGVLTGKVPGALTVQAAYVMAAPTGQASSTGQTLSSSAQVTITAAAAATTTPLITWNTPAAIQYGTALSSVQLDATANVPGSFAYTTAAGTVLRAGTQALSAVFTATDTTTYSAVTSTVQLTVTQAAPAVTWTPLAAVAQGTALSGAQLDGTANVQGTFSYNPPAGTVLPVGTRQLTATFSPSDTIDYAPVTANNSLTINAAATGTTTPLITWNAPAPIRYGTALSSVQLDATANVPGNFAYATAAGTLLKVGTRRRLPSSSLRPIRKPNPRRQATVQLTVSRPHPWSPGLQ